MLLVLQGLINKSLAVFPFTAHKNGPGKPTVQMHYNLKYLMSPEQLTPFKSLSHESLT